MRVALAEAALAVRVAASLVLQGPQMSEAVQAHQKAAPVDQAEQVGLVVRLAAEAELAALAQLVLQAEQVALVEQVALAATLLPDQAELVVQAESAAAPVLAELVEMFLLFLRPVAEAAGYSYLFRPWLPLPIGGNLLTTKKTHPFSFIKRLLSNLLITELPFLYSQLSHKGITNMSKKP